MTANANPPPAAGRPVSFLAVLSFLLGLAAVVPAVLILAGVPALVLGLVSLRRINQSDGRLRGAWLAVGGMILGGLGTLMTLSGLVVGLVLETREKADRLGCQNNLRLIGEGVALYNDQHQHYPPGTLPAPDLPPERRLSWLAGIVPDVAAALDLRGKAAQRKEPHPHGAALDSVAAALVPTAAWDAGANRAAVNVAIGEFICPSSRLRAPPGSPGLTTYVGLAGIEPNAATLPLTDRRAGFFGYDRILTQQGLQRARGESRTLMVMETAFENGPWAAGGFPTVRGLDPGQRPFLGPGRPFGGIHRTGCYALFSDGHVEFFRNDFGADKLEALVLIHAE
jgi:hypothetical protein